jgi:hypothetical protein
MHAMQLKSTLINIRHTAAPAAIAAAMIQTGVLYSISVYVTAICKIKASNSIRPNHNEQILLCFSIFKISVTSAAEERGVSTIGKMKNTYTILIRRPEVKRGLERTKLRSEDNIKMSIKLDVRVWTRFNCFRTWSIGGLL